MKENPPKSIMSMRTLAMTGLLGLFAACSGEAEGATHQPGNAPGDGLEAHATMARQEFVAAIDRRLEEFERGFRTLESRVVLAGANASGEVKAAIAALPAMRDAAVAEFARFKDAAATATVEQRRELVEFCRRLDRALRDAISKEG